MMVLDALVNSAGKGPPLPAFRYPVREDGRPLERSAATLKRHLASIQAICDDMHRPFEEIAGVYQIELLRMAADAAVVDYLPVLVEKHVRALYRRRLEARTPALP